jgi:hypothetical protein
MARAGSGRHGPVPSSAESKATASSDPTPPKYDVAAIEAVVLEVAAELHPEHPSTDGLLKRIVADPEDGREIATGKQAIRNLREFGLFAARDDELVEPTPAALRAIKLLASSPAISPL